MWKTVKLGDVLKTGAGGTPLKSKKEYYEDGNIKWLLSGAVCERDILDSKTHITEEGLANSSAKLFPRDTVLVAMYGATAGQVGILRTEAATNQAVCGIYPSSDYLPEFLYYYLSNYKETLLLEVSGVAQPNLSQIKIKNIPLPIIPLAEQQRIVAKLDAAFAEIDRAVEIAQQQMQQAHSIHQQKIDSVFGEISGDKTTLNDVCNLITCGVAARPEYAEEGITFLSAQNVKKGQVIYSNHKYITQEKHQELTKKNKPMRGDLLYTRVGSFGEAAVVESDIEFSVFVSLTLIKTKNELNPYYLKHYLNSQRIKTLASNSLSGSGVGNLNVGTVRKFPITLPSIGQQLEVVESLDDLSRSTERLYETYQTKAAQLQSLKSSILANELQPPQSEAA